MQNITQILSRYITSSTYDDLPSDIRHEGVRAFVNFVGCAAGGSREDEVQRALDVIGQFNGSAEASVIGRHERLDMLNAAFMNSMSSSSLAFNDTHFTTAAHPTSPVAAALLALAERRTFSGEALQQGHAFSGEASQQAGTFSGKALLHALILGIEVQCRVGNVIAAPPAECQVGLSMQGLVGPIGAAVAAGKVMGLDEHAMTTAIGLAANQASGLREAQSSMGSHFTPGHAARCGLLASFLAARGFTCSESMIEGPKGFAASYGRNARPEAAIEKLGQSFEISTLAYKPYPSGFVIHPIIEACLEIVRTQVFNAGEIERIELTLNPLAVKLTNIVDPRDRGQALVSFQHWAAVTLLQRAAGLAQVTDEVVRDPRVSELRRKVTYTADDSVARDAARVRVILQDGKTYEASVRQCRGSPGRPMTDDDIREKTRAQLETVYTPAAAERIHAECWRVEEWGRADTFCKLLVEGPFT